MEVAAAETAAPVVTPRVWRALPFSRRSAARRVLNQAKRARKKANRRKARAAECGGTEEQDPGRALSFVVGGLHSYYTNPI